MNRSRIAQCLLMTGVVLSLLLAGGCTTKPQVDWNARVGSFTYDQAVVELGPPDRVTELAPTVLPNKGAEVVVYCGSAT